MFIAVRVLTVYMVWTVCAWKVCSVPWLGFCFHSEALQLQDLTKDVVRIDVIPQQSLDTIRVGVLPWHLKSHFGSLLSIVLCHFIWI